MKKIVAVLLILAVLILGGYYGMGVMTERTLKKNVAMLDQSQDLSVRIDQYNRQWFKSTAVLHWQVKMPERSMKKSNGETVTLPAQTHDFEMPLTIFHGPIIVANNGVQFGLGAADTEVVLPKTFTDKFTSAFTSESTKPQMHLNLFVNYLNNTTLHIKVPAFKLVSKENGQQFEWQGMNNEIKFSSDFKRVNGDFTLSGLQFMKDQLHLVLNRFDSDYDLHLTDVGLFLGQGDISVSSVKVTHQEEVLLNIEQFKLHAESDVLNGLFQSDMNVSVGQFGSHEQSYGPGHVKFAIKNMDAKVLLDINEQMNKMQQGNDLEKQQAVLTLFSELPALVSKGAELHVSELKLTLPEGDLQANLTLALPNESMSNPMMIVQKLKGQAKIVIPMTVVQSLVEEAARHKLMKQSALQQALVQQMQTTAQNTDATKSADGSTPIPGAPPQAPVSVDKTNTATLPANELTDAPKDPAITASNDVMLQAKTLASEKIATMLKAGALVAEGKHYLIELQLEQGQLMVNGKPFHPTMVPIL